MGRLLLSFFITLVIVGTIGTIGYIFYQNQDLKEINKIKEKTIRDISYQNEKLKYENNNLRKLINRYQKTNRNLSKTLNRKTKYKNIKIIEPYRKTKKQHNKTQKRQKQYPNFLYNNNKKIYHKYSGYTKLVSDSEIKKRNDGRFKSNSPIYGIYKHRLFGNISCGKNPEIYNVENECNAYEPYTYDMLYFSKSNIRDLKTFNTRDHKIECLYDQDYGIMQDCKVKIFKFLYN
jgi:FtsZ-binding cell division protein ZapB